MLVAADGESTVIEIDTGVDSLEGAVGWVAFLIATDDIVAHVKGDDLLEVEHVLDDNDGAAAFFISLLIGMLVFLTLAELAHADADAKLLATIGTFENQ